MHYFNKDLNNYRCRCGNSVNSVAATLASTGRDLVYTSDIRLIHERENEEILTKSYDWKSDTNRKQKKQQKAHTLFSKIKRLMNFICISYSNVDNRLTGTTFSLPVTTRHVLMGQIHPQAQTPVSRTKIKSSPSNLTLKSYGPDTDFGYVCTVTLTLGQGMTHPWVMDSNCVKYYAYPTWQWRYCTVIYFVYKCTVTLALKIWPWIEIMTHPWVMDNTCVKYYPYQTWQWRVMARTRNLGMCALWPWPWRYDLGSKSWHILGPWTTIVWILSTSNMAVRSYGPDTEFGYVCTVTLTLEVWPWVKVMTHPWVMDNNCVNIIHIQHGSEELWSGHGFWMRALWPWPWIKVMTHPWVMDNYCVKYYPDRTSGLEVMARTRCEQTDGQTDGRTDRVIPIYPPPNFVCGGIIIHT